MDSPNREIIEQLQCLGDYQLTVSPVLQIGDSRFYKKEQ